MILFLGSVDDASKARDYSPRLFVHRHGVQNRRSAIASVPLELALPGHRVRPPLGEGAKRLRGNTLPPVSLFKAASTVSLLTLASRITGLVRELLMASVFGGSALTRWMFPYIGFMSLVALARGILNTWKKFAVPAASPVLLNIALILSITVGAPWFSRHGIEPIYAQAAGVMLGGLLQLAIQVPALVRLGLLPRIGVRWAAIRAA